MPSRQSTYYYIRTKIESKSALTHEGTQTVMLEQELIVRWLEMFPPVVSNAVFK
jgi:hypothetical protein